METQLSKIGKIVVNKKCRVIGYKFLLTSISVHMNRTHNKYEFEIYFPLFDMAIRHWEIDSRKTYKLICATYYPFSIFCTIWIYIATILCLLIAFVFYAPYSFVKRTMIDNSFTFEPIEKIGGWQLLFYATIGIFSIIDYFIGIL